MRAKGKRQKEKGKRKMAGGTRRPETGHSLSKFFINNFLANSFLSEWDIFNFLVLISRRLPETEDRGRV